MGSSSNYASGAVITPHYLATLAGYDVLRSGGNAVDAIVAANLALGVVAPYYCGYGGDLLALVHDGDLHGYRSTGRSAAGSDARDVRSEGHQTMPHFGAHTITVPGAVRGWFELLQRFGTQTFRQLAQRALVLAAEGFVLTKPGAFRLAGSMAILRAMGIDDSDLRENYPEVRANHRVVQPGLAKLIDTLSADGWEPYYEGEVAQAIVASVQRSGGSLTIEDLAGHTGAWVTPLRAEFRGRTVIELPPPTQGVTALQMLRIVDGLDLGHDGPDRDHVMIETAKLALADRDEFVADPDAMTIATSAMLSDEWIGDRRLRIDPNRAIPMRHRPGADGGTAYMCCTDGNGLSISLIQSNFTAIGSGVHVPGWGINLHNRGSAFSLEAAHPNVLAGGKLPLHTLIPAMVLRDDVPTHVFGTMGGHAQAQVHLQLLVQMLIDGKDPQLAIDAPRFHVDPGSGVVQLEARYSDAVQRDLVRRGHEIRVLRDFDDAMGHAHAIEFLDTGAIAVGADPRAESAALGV